ncbi:MAG: ATP-binding protein [Bacteroidales bacterium]|nr:ATP-binding protein [Bacteroidales bacterium]
MVKIKDTRLLLERLNTFSAGFTTIQTLTELAGSVEKVLDDIFDIEFSGLYLYDFKEQRLTLLIAKGFTPEELDEADRTAFKRHPGHVFRTGEILNIPDTENDPEQRSISSERSFVVRSRLYVPVMNGKQTVGVFGIVSSEKNRFDGVSVSVFSFICNIAGGIYGKILTQDELRTTSLIARETDNAVVISGKEGKTEWVNSSFEKITGYTLDEIRGKRPGELLQGALTDPKSVMEIADAIREQRPIETDIINYHKNGTPYWVRLQIQPVFDETGQLTHFISIQRDITEQKKVQEEMESITTRLSTLIKNLHSGILVEDHERKIALVNTAFCELFAIPVDPELLIGSDCSQSAEQSKGLFRDPEGFVKHIDHILKELKPVISEELDMADGRTLERDYIPILFQGKFLGNLWQYRDTTAKKNYETNLRKAMQEAEAANSAKSLFLAKMSHEIRTPLNAIIGLSKIIRDTSLNPEQKKLNDKLLMAGDNLLGVVNEILDFSKIEAGKVVLESIPFSLRDVMKRVYSFQEHAAEEKMIKLEVRVDDRIPAALKGDPVRLQQIFTNLVSNAIKFTHEGGIGVDCTLQQSGSDTVTLTCSVTDTGIGISEENLVNIFEGFRQEDDSVTRLYGGTGLGLTICRQLVSLMGGTLEVESRRGAGSRFFFTIELGISDENLLAAEKKKPVIDLQALKNKVILVVEDNDFNQFIAKSILEKWGARVEVAANGQEAINQLWLSDIDLVLMDMQMPVMDGITATRIIRKDLNKTIPIIALTANVTQEAIKTAFEAGMNEYISKPFDEDDLYIKILTLFETPISYDNGQNIHFEDAPVVMQEGSYFNPETLNSFFQGNKAQIRSTLELFIEHIPKYYNDLQNAWENRDPGGITQAAHKIKSSIDMVASSQIREIILKIHNFQHEGLDLDVIGSLIRDGKTRIDLLVTQIREYLDGLAGDQ